MALRPPSNVAPQVPENATAEGVHSPVDMHQVGDLVPVPCKMQPSAIPKPWGVPLTCPPSCNKECSVMS